MCVRTLKGAGFSGTSINLGSGLIFSSSCLLDSLVWLQIAVHSADFYPPPQEGALKKEHRSRFNTLKAPKVFEGLMEALRGRNPVGRPAMAEGFLLSLFLFYACLFNQQKLNPLI